jgi:hypothetical protein
MQRGFRDRRVPKRKLFRCGSEGLTPHFIEREGMVRDRHELRQL